MRRNKQINPFVHAQRVLKMPDNRFKKRIMELLGMVDRLTEKEQRGFRYKQVYVGPTNVKAHKRSGYYSYRAVKK